MLLCGAMNYIYKQNNPTYTATELLRLLKQQEHQHQQQHNKKKTKQKWKTFT